jgi:bifunctional non-homologous end joining protein LigD
MKAAGIEISRPDKVFYSGSGLTKGDIAEYYADVADVMLPHLRGRPLTLRRFPDGIDGEGWFQKEASDYFPDWIRVEEIPQREGGSVHHVLCEDTETLVYLANQATLEHHIWLSTVDHLERPDLLVIDLDPPDDADVAELRDVARRVRKLYERLGLAAFVQATGGRGFHVVAPLDASTEFDTVRELAVAAADHLADEDTDRLTTAQRKNKRGDRIFLDTNRNAYGQTFIAPYSTRSRPGAPVATPLDWAELGTAEPDGWDVKKIRARLARKKDPWHDIHAHAASAAKARDALAELT